MKTKKNELDVDFIGIQEPLSKEEEIALTDFFSRKKSILKSSFLKKRDPKIKNRSANA